jgi:hypothetical protein
MSEGTKVLMVIAILLIYIGWLAPLIHQRWHDWTPMTYSLSVLAVLLSSIALLWGPSDAMWAGLVILGRR